MQMRTLLLCGLVLVLLAGTVVAEESSINPRVLQEMNRQRFLGAWQAYPIQPVTVKTYTRSDSAALFKNRFMQPNSPNPPQLRVKMSQSGGLYGGKRHLTPYWKNSVAWGKYVQGARGNPVRK